MYAQSLPPPPAGLTIYSMVEIFLTMLSPPEGDSKDWISYNGVGEAVLESHWKCAAMLSPVGHGHKKPGFTQKSATMIKCEAVLAPRPVGHAHKKRLGFNETNAISALRKEYRENFHSVIQANLEMYSKRFEMTLDNLVQELTERNTMQDQDSAVLSPTPQIGLARVEAVDDMAELGMWRNISDHSENISNMEKIMNEITDIMSNAVELASSSNGLVGLVKTVLVNNEVKAIGNRILEGVPTLMSALETLMEIHPFLEGRSSAATTIKIEEVMSILLGKDDTRTTPDGKPVLRRIASICADMKDIEECYNGTSLDQCGSRALIAGKALYRDKVS
ncbi:hypothetical protein DFH08DRAFT_819972 [Mycena albidolilacea]|uniref:Uncharacterized protein n=1 Tax=Mycena albidolilacea TaxID=1033008 RepID=A0AAD7EF21_9AGAR|nr:hypothetical protein DFH08DRAFT_819972 [Mycena albidolilacea]